MTEEKETKSGRRKKWMLVAGTILVIAAVFTCISWNSMHPSKTVTMKELQSAKVVHIDFPELPELEMLGIYGEILMERQEWKAAVKDQVKMILKYKPEAVFVGNNTFAAYPVVHMLRKKHIPVLTLAEKNGEQILVRIPSGS